LTSHFQRAAWLNPVPERSWQFVNSTTITRQLLGDRMFPLTLEGIDRMTRELGR
jgi:uncharacterized protein